MNKTGNRRLWKEQFADKDGQILTQAKRTYFLYSDEGLLAEATQDISLNADGTTTASTPAAIVTQYGSRPDSAFMTGTLFVKTRNTNGADTVAYFHHDLLNTPLQATDKQGNVVWSANYDVFGRATITTPQATAGQPTITQNLRFPGQYEDEETGFHYNLHRYYSPEEGRYLTPDRIGLRGGINDYLYGGHQPLTNTDPYGMMPELLQQILTKAGQEALKQIGPRLFGPTAFPTEWEQPNGLGCGSGGNDPLVPDAFISYDFIDPCAVHDRCYPKCEMSKAECDTTFLDDMQKNCEEQSWVSRMLGGMMSCRALARLYYISVDIGGKSAFCDRYTKNTAEGKPPPCKDCPVSEECEK
jgi:RHS repeat-associated protein